MKFTLFESPIILDFRKVSFVSVSQFLKILERFQCVRLTSKLTVLRAFLGVKFGFLRPQSSKKWIFSSYFDGSDVYLMSLSYSKLVFVELTSLKRIYSFLGWKNMLFFTFLRFSGIWFFGTILLFLRTLFMILSWNLDHTCSGRCSTNCVWGFLKKKFLTDFWSKTSKF